MDKEVYMKLSAKEYNSLGRRSTVPGEFGPRNAENLKSLRGLAIGISYSWWEPIHMVCS